MTGGLRWDDEDVEPDELIHDEENDTQGQVDESIVDYLSEIAEDVAPTVGQHTTPELHQSSDVGRFADFETSAPTAINSASRIDPFYKDIWPSGARASWVSAKGARDQESLGLSRVPSYLSFDQGEAAARILDPSRTSFYLDIYAALDHWRVMTAEQLAAATGDARLAGGKSAVMRDLFAVGAIDVGVLHNALHRGKKLARATVYRLASNSVFFQKHVFPEITYAEWLTTTGADTSRMNGQGHDRHGVLTSEVALRVAEYGAHIGSVVGERFSTANALGYTSLGLPSQDTAKFSKSGDMTVIRKDGARVVIELTDTVGRALDQKINTWAKLLSERRHQDSGLSVIFLTAESGMDKTKTSGWVRNTVYKMIKEAARRYPGPSFDRTANRLGVADWREWFPAEGKVSDLFPWLTADFPTEDGTWVQRSALRAQFAPTGAHLQDSVVTLRSLRGVPVWLRDGHDDYDVWKFQMAAAGFTSIPVPAPARPELYDGVREFGKAWGVSGDTKPPKRMRP